jgi:hypothetical protein
VDEIWQSITRCFEIDGELVDVEHVRSGHIHDTFLARYRRGADEDFRLVHQRLNGRVFRDLEALMQNVVRVTGHLRTKLLRRGVPDLGRRCLSLVPARNGRPLYIDAEGRPWRTYLAIEGARTVDSVERPEQAYEAARVFGEFTALLDDLRSPPLAVTIPDFHDLALRFAALEAARRQDRCGRATGVHSEAGAAARGFASIEEALARGGASELPRRVVHHDCKINNVMLDNRSGEGLCVIDLDTVMEGRILSDFGELVRTTVCPSPEDAQDLALMRLDLELFAAVARGYLAGTAGMLVGAERRLLPLAGPVFALMNAIRFLTDHLEGDVYFRIHREDHNLDRSRAQLRLFALMMEHQPQFSSLLAEASASEPGA